MAPDPQLGARTHTSRTTRQRVIGLLLGLPREHERHNKTGARRVSVIRILLLRAMVLPTIVGTLNLHALVFGYVGFVVAVVAKLPFRLLLSRDPGERNVGIDVGVVPVMVRGLPF